MTNPMKERVYKADFPVICADSHIWESPVIFSEYLEPKYREMAKLYLSDSGQMLGNLVHGKNPGTSALYRMFRDTEEAYEDTLKAGGPWANDYWFPGANDGPKRLSCMDAEGIDASIVRNTFMAGIMHLACSQPDLVIALCKAYNNWIKDFCDADPNRLYPEALLPCFDMDVAMKEMERTAKMGFKATVLPGSTATGCPLSDPYWDKMFSCMEEMGWPLNIHPAFNPNTDSAQAFLYSPNKMMSSSKGAYFLLGVHFNFMLDNIVTLGEITLGGMLDKHPKLKVFFIESGSSWASESIYRLDKAFSTPFAGAPATDLWCRGMTIGAKTLPSEQVARQVYFMFEGGDRGHSKESVERFADNLIWCSDIPHFDGDGPWEGGGCLRNVLKVSKEVEMKIMGGNAAKLLNIPYVKRLGTSKNAAPIEIDIPEVA